MWTCFFTSDKNFVKSEHHIPSYVIGEIRLDMSRWLMNVSGDRRRADRVKRFKVEHAMIPDEYISDLLNIIGMVFAVSGLMMKIKWCAWLALFCSAIGFANSRSSADVNEDSKQIFSSFMLSMSAIAMSYLQNPTPMTLPLFGNN